jgi:hypothetical protein
VVDKNDLYRSFGTQEVKISGSKIIGNLLNYGTEEISIPKLLISYSDNNDDLVWVETSFMREGVRQQRKRPFEVPLAQLNKLELIKKGTNEDFYVNGLANKKILKYKSEGSDAIKNNSLNIRITPDAYVASPTLY